MRRKPRKENGKQKTAAAYCRSEKSTRNRAQMTSRHARRYDAPRGAAPGPALSLLLAFPRLTDCHIRQANDGGVAAKMHENQNDSID